MAMYVVQYRLHYHDSDYADVFVRLVLGRLISLPGSVHVCELFFGLLQFKDVSLTAS